MVNLLLALNPAFHLEERLQVGVVDRAAVDASVHLLTQIALKLVVQLLNIFLQNTYKTQKLQSVGTCTIVYCLKNLTKREFIYVRVCVV